LNAGIVGGGTVRLLSKVSGGGGVTARDAHNFVRV
jgi:hypothetical protein